MKRYYPVFLDLCGKRVLVAGGGEVALRKVLKALEAGASILIVSPELCQELADVVRNEDGVTWIRKEISRHDIPDDAWLVIAATNEPSVQRMLYEEAGKRKIFCNIVDQPEISSFIVPSSIRCGDLDVAMSTGGRSPAVAKLARRELQEYFDWKWDIFLEIAGMFRKVVLDSELAAGQKGEICAAMGNPDVLRWISENRMDKVSEWISVISGNELEDALAPLKAHVMSVEQRNGKDSGKDE